MPGLDLLFARDGELHRAEQFEVHQPVHPVPPRIGAAGAGAMLKHALDEVRCDPDVGQRARPASKDVNRGLEYVAHGEMLSRGVRWCQGKAAACRTSPAPNIRHAELVSASVGAGLRGWVLCPTAARDPETSSG